MQTFTGNVAVNSTVAAQGFVGFAGRQGEVGLHWSLLQQQLAKALKAQFDPGRQCIVFAKRGSRQQERKENSSLSLAFLTNTSSPLPLSEVEPW